MTREEKEHEDLPQGLIDQLKSADQPVSMITSRVDREISRLAESQFSSRRRPFWNRRPALVAIAATVLVTLFFVQLRGPQVDEQVPIYADLDNSGRIDIADVLHLARSRGSEQESQADIDAFAMRIVSLASLGETS